MAIREVRAKGLEYLALATSLLQRARLSDAEAGVWDAADLQWWWRTPRRSDLIDQLFWVDDEGPVAAAVLMEWDQAWECYPLLVPGTPVSPATVWARVVEAIDALELEVLEMLVRDDDTDLLRLIGDSGFVDGAERSWFTWMEASDRPEVAALPGGFALVDRAQPSKPHPMRHRNGEAVEERLRQGSLYDPALDLAVETADGQVAGYALFWFDPVTEVGLVEPMRAEDEFQRRGLARALLTEGLERLACAGARRLKVGFASDAGRGLYLGAGFRVAATARSYRGTV